MEKLKLHTLDLTAQNIERLAQLFPNCVTETQDEQGRVARAIDFDQLRQELSGSIVDGPRERYHLDWPGKREAILAANAPIAKTLRPYREESVDFDTTKNLFIEGDNLDALKLLQETYLGKVRLIYIDPPYNTGNDFIYDDDFAESTETYLRRSNQEDQEGGRLVANADSNGRFHSDWLTMMYSRLRLARNLLPDEGILLASIGPEELKNLVGILGEVFGEENRVSILTWEKGRKNDSSFFSESAEYIAVFAKNKLHLSSLGKWREKKEGLDVVLQKYSELRQAFGLNHPSIEAGMRKFYDSMAEDDPAKKLVHFSRSDDRGLFFGDNISSASTSIPDYEIIHPITKKPVKKPARGWGATEPVMLERIKDDRVLFGTDEKTIPLKKSYLSETDSTVKTPVFYKDGRAASGVLKNLFESVIFNNPKDHVILADLISYCLQSSKDAIVLDFFAGSSSTAQAVMALNSKDNGKRRFIMCQLPEALDEDSATSPAAKQTIRNAIRFLESNKLPLTIAEISKERIRRVGKSMRKEDKLVGDNVDLGFRVLKIDTSNMREVYYIPDSVQQGDLLGHVDNIRSDRAPEDLLFQVLVDWGLDLALPIAHETIAGKTVFFVDGDALAACFDSGVTDELVKEIAKRKPLRVIFRDASYGSDSVKINVDQIFRLLSPETEVRSI
jgi:adenine-specific DNA-methyltransferase